MEFKGYFDLYVSVYVFTWHQSRIPNLINFVTEEKTNHISWDHVTCKQTQVLLLIPMYAAVEIVMKSTFVPLISK